jgi:antitoxin HicB
MAMAGWYAALPADGKRLMGDTDGFADEANGARADLFASQSPGCLAWAHQENASNAGGRSGLGAEAPGGVGAMTEKLVGETHMGSSIDDFLKEEGIFEEAQAQAVKEVVAWQLAEAMRVQKISKNKMAMLLKTSRSQVDRLLDPTSDITLTTLQRAAAMVGRRVSIELI